MIRAGRAPVGKRIRPGLKAGATVGLLTGLCYILLLSDVDFSRGNPAAPLLALPPRVYLLFALMVVVGAAVGAVVSLGTSDE